MSITYILSNLQLVDRNLKWLSVNGVNLSSKFKYYPAIFISYYKLLVGKKKIINYLGKNFYFDNPATPLNLQIYPHEICNKILANMGKPPKYILDIGSNTGQFAVTLNELSRIKTRIDCLEPNPAPYKILTKNLRPGMRAFNIGVSTINSQLKFYYEKNRTAIGSAFFENAGEKSAVKTIKVDVTNNVSSVTGRNVYDLVKVDVEGYELEVLKGLKNISTKYLFIEVSTSFRKRNYNEAKFFKQISDSLGEFEIMYASKVNVKMPTYDLLLKFV